jgi:NAD(P)-dependent dehydrogenase (short-subunit alcohol dehydrogenase family)
MAQLTDKVALVAGAGHGIGRVIVLTMARGGVHAVSGGMVMH